MDLVKSDGPPAVGGLGEKAPFALLLLPASMLGILHQVWPESEALKCAYQLTMLLGWLLVMLWGGGFSLPFLAALPRLVGVVIPAIGFLGPFLVLWGFTEGHCFGVVALTIFLFGQDRALFGPPTGRRLLTLTLVTLGQVVGVTGWHHPFLHLAEGFVTAGVTIRLLGFMLDDVQHKATEEPIEGLSRV